MKKEYIEKVKNIIKITFSNLKVVLTHLSNVTFDMKKGLTLERFANLYSNILEFLTKIIKLTVNFCSTLTLLIPAINNPVVLLKAAVSVAVYSKILLVLSPTLGIVIPIPSIIISLASEYWNAVITGYFIIASPVITFITQYKEQRTADSVKEIDEARELVLKEIQTLFETYQTNLNSELESQRQTVENTIKNQQDTINELTSDNKVLENTNKKLSMQNTELLNEVKGYKLATYAEKISNFTTTAINAGVVSIQLLNAYSNWKNGQIANPQEIKQLLHSVNNLLGRLDRQQVQLKSVQRAAESMSTQEPSKGATDKFLSTDEEF